MALAVLAALTLAACGNAANPNGGASAANPAAGSAPGSLHITYWPHGQDRPGARAWTLRCGPAGGSHPKPRQACRELAANAALLAPPRRACAVALRRDAPVALVRGRYAGRAIDRLIRPGCGAAFSALHALLSGA